MIYLNNYLNVNDKLNQFQSGFRHHHSTQALLIHVLNDICVNTDSGETSALVLPDLSATFNTVDHLKNTSWQEKVKNWVGLSDAVLSWLRSYLKDRGSLFPLVIINLSRSAWNVVSRRVWFNLYMFPLGQIIHDNNGAYHSNTDDTRIALPFSQVTVVP